MNLDQFLVSKQPVEKQVTLPDGSQHRLYFLEPTAAEIRRWHDAETSNDIDRRIYCMQELIAACLYDVSLKRLVFEGDNYNKHRQLNYEACLQMTAAIQEIVGLNQQKKPLCRGAI